MTIRSSSAVPLLLFAGMLAGCDDDDSQDARMGEASDGAAEAQAVSRDAHVRDPTRDAAVGDAEVDAGVSDRCDRLDAPFERRGDGGAVVARFVSIDPGFDYKGHYDWTLELRDRSGKAIGDAELEAEADMPSHGHGTTPITLKHPSGSARYQLIDVNLFMAGKWEVKVAVTAGGATDRIVFRACPRDPPDAGGEDGGQSRGGH
jgi:hypothetical protein